MVILWDLWNVVVTSSRLFFFIMSTLVRDHVDTKNHEQQDPDSTLTGCYYYDYKLQCL